MNPVFKDKLSLTASDDLLVESLQALFTEVIEQERPIVGSEDNQLLGERFRAYEQARELINKTFIALKALERGKINKTNLNKAI